MANGEWRMVNKSLFTVYATVTVLSLLAAVGFQSIFPAAIPVVLLLGYLAVVDFRRLFFLLLLCIPFSIEYTFPNGFGTDLPTEPLMVGLMLVYFLYVAKSGFVLRGGAFSTPSDYAAHYFVFGVGIGGNDEFIRCFPFSQIYAGESLVYRHFFSFSVVLF